MRLTFTDNIMTHRAEEIDREDFYSREIVECILSGKELPDPNNSEVAQPDLRVWRRIDTPVPDLSEDAEIFRGMHGDYIHLQREEVDPEGRRYITIIGYPRKESGEKAILEYTFMLQDSSSMDPSDRTVLPNDLEGRYYLGSLDVIRVEKSGIFKQQSSRMIVGIPNPSGSGNLTFSVSLKPRILRYKGQNFKLSANMAPYSYQMGQNDRAHEYVQLNLAQFRVYIGSKSLLESLQSKKK